MFQRVKVVGIVLATFAAVLAVGAQTAGAADQLSCEATVIDGELRIEIDDDGDGRWAANLRRGDEFVFLGRHRTTSIVIDAPDELRDGNWRIEARAIRPDGTKTNRVTCGEPSAAPQFSCFAVDTGNGTASASVVTEERFGNATLNFRDSSWISTGDPINDQTIFNTNSGGDLRRVPTTVVIRQGGERFTIPCTGELYEGVEIGRSTDTTAHIVTVDAVFADHIVWSQNRRPREGFRSFQENFLTTSGQDAVAIGGSNVFISSSEPLCGERVLAFNGGFTDDPIGAIGVIDPVAGEMWISMVEFGEISADCSRGVVTVTGDGITDTYNFN